MQRHDVYQPWYNFPVDLDKMKISNYEFDVSNKYSNRNLHKVEFIASKVNVLEMGSLSDQKVNSCLSNKAEWKSNMAIPCRRHQRLQSIDSITILNW